MSNVNKGLIALAALGFILAVVSTLINASILGISAEGFSRGCSNLALIAIAMSLIGKAKTLTTSAS